METATAEKPRKTERALRRFSPPVLIAVLFFHLLLGGLATVWVVSRFSSSRQLTFRAGPKSPNPSTRALQQRAQLAKHNDARNTPAVVPQRILTRGEAKISLPPMPQIKPNSSSTHPTLAAAAGNFGAMSGALGGNGLGSAINFFGIRDISNSVVIMIDVSDSMFGRTGDLNYRTHKLVRKGKAESFQRVRDEAIKLVQSLTPATRFGIVRWSGGAYSWKPQLVPATEENKVAAIAHIQDEIDYQSAPRRAGSAGGTRHDFALEEAFKLKPQTIYMLTDGNATGVTPEQVYAVAAAGQKELATRAHLHVLYYLTGEERKRERDFLQQLAARNGGQFRIIKAKNGASGKKRK